MPRGRLGEIRSCVGQLRTAMGRANVAHEVTRAVSGRPELPREVHSILFICQGNICRSPFAAELFRRARPDLTVRSAGLRAGDGAPAEPGAIRVANEQGIDLQEHRSTPMDDEIVEWADLIVGMEGFHVREVQRRWPGTAAKTRIVGDFLPRAPRRIVDPWGQPDAEFRRVFSQIAAGSQALLEELEHRGTDR